MLYYCQSIPDSIIFGVMSEFYVRFMCVLCIFTFSTYTFATLLDPRYKDRLFGERKREIVNNFIALFTKISRDENNDDIVLKGLLKLTFFTICFIIDTAKIANNDALLHAVDDANEIHLPVDNISELFRYLEKPTEEMCPIQWWAKNKCDFPLLSKLAAQYLSSPPSSVASEQLFSLASDIYVKKRKCLLPENSEMLCFLKKSLPLINYKYNLIQPPPNFKLDDWIITD
jgi:hypothetical protein